MSSPTPVQSFLGGLALPLPVHTFLVLNGSVFGISGFVRRAICGEKEAIGVIAGFLLGGMAVGLLEGQGSKGLKLSLPQVLLSGLLVGVGTTMANGCTSGHMIAGISRFSLRSITATATFFVTGAITARIFHGGLSSNGRTDLSLGPVGGSLLALQAIPLLASIFLYFSVPAREQDEARKPYPFLRLITSLLTGFEFSLALRLSNMSDPKRVVSFLLLPFHKAFDPSLAYLAAGALPLTIYLYQFCRGPEAPRLGGAWTVPKNQQIDLRLVCGAALFGIGWGMSGICPGPGLVNLGRAISSGSDLTQTVGWLGFVLLGSVLV